MLLGPTLVHNPSGISIGSAIFAVRESVIGMLGHALLLKIASSHGGSVPHPISGSLGPPDSASQMASIGSAVFAQFTAEYPYTLQQAAPFPQKLPFPWEGSGPHLIHGSLGPPESSTQTASWSVQLFLQGSLLWQTNRPRYMVGNNRPHLCTCTTMWPN